MKYSMKPARANTITYSHLQSKMRLFKDEVRQKGEAEQQLEL